MHRPGGQRVTRHVHVRAEDVEAHVEAITANREREWLARRLSAHAWPIAVAPRDVRCAWCGAVLAYGSSCRGMRLRLAHEACRDEFRELAGAGTS